MKKPSKILLLATVCMVVLFAGCASDYMDDPDYRAGAMNDPCTHEWILQRCPGGLFYDPIYRVCDWPPDLVPGYSSWYYQCASCNAVTAAGGGQMYMQDTLHNCVATAIMWICHQMGRMITLDEIYFKSGYNGEWDGIPLYDFYGIVNIFFTTESATNLFDALDSGNIVIATINGGTHCVVIVGRAGLEWLYNDPSLGGPGSTFNQGYFNDALIITGLR